MADDTQGSAKQRNPGAGTNPAAQDKGAKAAASRDRTSTRRARAAAPRQIADDFDRGRADKRPTAEQIAKREPVRYRAMDRGYVDGKIVEPGEVFVTRADMGSWMEKVKSGSDKYTVEEAADEAGYAKKLDVNYENMSEAGLEALAALVGVSDPGALKKDDLITAIRAARIPVAQ
jgi:hypothetical protein